MAKGGLIFVQEYSSSTVCTYSRSAIMMGKHPSRLKITNFLLSERAKPESAVLPGSWQKFLPSEEITFAERHKPLGYHNGMIDKLHLDGAGFNLLKTRFVITSQS